MLPVSNDPDHFQLKNMTNKKCLDAGGANNEYQYAKCDPNNDLQKWKLYSGYRGGQMIKNKKSATCAWTPAPTSWKSI